MRLIDADALLESLKKTDRYFMLKADIDNAPTVELRMGRMTNGVIIPIKRPQGEWITTRTMLHDGDPYCSICDEENIIRSNFCPNCGASMKPKTCTNCETFGGGCGDCEVGDDE